MSKYFRNMAVRAFTTYSPRRFFSSRCEEAMRIFGMNSAERRGFVSITHPFEEDSLLKAQKRLLFDFGILVDDLNCFLPRLCVTLPFGEEVSYHPLALNKKKSLLVQLTSQLTYVEIVGHLAVNRVCHLAHAIHTLLLFPICHRGRWVLIPFKNHEVFFILLSLLIERCFVSAGESKVVRTRRS